jgi:hypothetical protein
MDSSINIVVESKMPVVVVETSTSTALLPMGRFDESVIEKVVAIPW